MASLIVDGSDLVVKMSEVETFEALHRDIRVRLSTVRAVRVVDDAWPELRGIRAPGTGIPGVIAVGTRRGSFGKDFAVVHGGDPAVVIELADAEYSRIVVTTPDAEGRGRADSGPPDAVVRRASALGLSNQGMKSSPFAWMVVTTCVTSPVRRSSRPR